MFASLIFVFTVSLLTNAESIASSPLHHEANTCLLPPYPEHGSYSVSNHPPATPGDRYSSVKLDISCDTGYLLNNTVKTIFCVNGDWSSSMPTCDRFCTLPTEDLKVEYRCLWFSGTLGWSWECESTVPSGTLVRPICRTPGYFSLRALPEMHCTNGTWNYDPSCKRACGLTTQHLQLEGTSSNHLQLPWHVVVYEKTSESYYQQCGGSLITDTKIISSAFCFHDFKDKIYPASDFIVAVNKMYLKYNDTRDRNSQYSEIIDIIIPSSYRGIATKFEDNIAIVVVKTPFFFHLSVRPVCLDFDNDLDRTQLTEGHSGKTTRWSSVINNGQSSNVFDLPYMKYEDCVNMLPTDIRPYLTKDKFCARYRETGSSLSYYGNALVFLESTTQRYFLRGVYSGYLMKKNSTMIYLYTSIVKQEHFIKQHL